MSTVRQFVDALPTVHVEEIARDYETLNREAVLPVDACLRRAINAFQILIGQEPGTHFNMWTTTFALEAYRSLYIRLGTHRR